jgi:hypothetical protein
VATGPSIKPIIISCLPPPAISINAISLTSCKGLISPEPVGPYCDKRSCCDCVCIGTGDRSASRVARRAVAESRGTTQVPTRSGLNKTCSGCSRSGCPTTGSIGIRGCTYCQTAPAIVVLPGRWLHRKLQLLRSDRSWRRGMPLREILAWTFSFASSALRIGTACGCLVARALRREFRCVADLPQGRSHGSSF